MHLLFVLAFAPTAHACAMPPVAVVPAPPVAQNAVAPAPSVAQAVVPEVAAAPPASPTRLEAAMALIDATFVAPARAAILPAPPPAPNAPPTAAAPAVIAEAQAR